MLDEALKMLKELRNGWTFSETEIVEMIDGLRERGKELEHKDKLDLFEALEEKECWNVADELEEFIQGMG